MIYLIIDVHARISATGDGSLLGLIGSAGMILSALGGIMVVVLRRQ
jgi:hypothetical protein